MHSVHLTPHSSDNFLFIIWLPSSVWRALVYVTATSLLQISKGYQTWE